MGVLSTSRAGDTNSAIGPRTSAQACSLTEVCGREEEGVTVLLPEALWSMPRLACSRRKQTTTLPALNRGTRELIFCCLLVASACILMQTSEPIQWGAGEKCSGP